jgi:hypothetical protein
VRLLDWVRFLMAWLAVSTIAGVFVGKVIAYGDRAIRKREWE